MKMAQLKKILGKLLPDSYKPFTMFPYPFVGRPCEILAGVLPCGLPYAEYAGIRVCFPRGFSLEDVVWTYRGYLEDEGLTGWGRRKKSPHCYVTPAHRPNVGDIIVDIGCSEGFFSRSFASEAKKIYLFESDGKWDEPIRETFHEYWDKVVFTAKFVGAKTDETGVRLEEVLPAKSNDTYFLKMDVEGAEREILESSERFLTHNRVKMSCCAYHRQDDGRYLTNLLKQIGFTTEYSEGWMLPYGSRTFPFFRRGVIYARNF